MAKIISVATAVPPHKHQQSDILTFMQQAYQAGEKENRILKYLYQHSGIESRYSTIADYTVPMDEWVFFPQTENLEPFPSLEQRMEWFQQYAWQLSLQAANKCLDGVMDKKEITHLITVSCTGLCAPGLELQLMEAMQLERSVTRSAVNFMGCYAAIHALKQARDIVQANKGANVLVVCTELCTLHFQKTFTEDSITSTLLFGEGSAAVLVTGDEAPQEGLHLDGFYSEIIREAKSDMSWQLSSLGFIMTLTSEVPDFIKREIKGLKNKAMEKAGLSHAAIKYWCFHPGGKRILESIAAGLSLTAEDMAASYNVLRQYGNMSSPTLLFVLSELWPKVIADKGAPIFSAAFGPGLTVESMILSAI